MIIINITFSVFVIVNNIIYILKHINSNNDDDNVYFYYNCNGNELK